MRYVIEGALDEVVWPALPPVRADDLWRSTCLEAFLAAGGGAYRECNMTTSGAWAAYAFAAYRSGMAALDVPPPSIVATREAGRLELVACWSLGGRHAGRLGLSAVIEHADGDRSYWALAHPPGTPDFHHDDCFAGRLEPTGAA